MQLKPSLQRDAQGSLWLLDLGLPTMQAQSTRRVGLELSAWGGGASTIQAQSKRMVGLELSAWGAGASRPDLNF
eukprot:203207-Chlamydomonas_euryale.AAC.4